MRGWKIIFWLMVAVAIIPVATEGCTPWSKDAWVLTTLGALAVISALAHLYVLVRPNTQIRIAAWILFLGSTIAITNHPAYKSVQDNGDKEFFGTVSDAVKDHNTKKKTNVGMYSSSSEVLGLWGPPLVR